MSDFLADLKAIESQASTVLGVAEGHVVTPARELAKQVRALIEKHEPKDEGDVAEPDEDEK